MTAVLADARRGHPGLFWFAVSMAVLAPVLAVLSVVDDRVLLGAPLWFKPLKFAVSFVAYAGALAWMLGQLRGGDRSDHDASTPRSARGGGPASNRTMQRTGWVIVATSVVEMVIIVGQAGRGVRSHYNDDSAFDAALFSIMGATVAVMWLATLAVALRFLREPGRDRAAGSAVRLGLAVALLGMAVGYLMATGGSHAVGVPDGGSGLPLVGWSTTGGDLRIAHFVGMHALQVLPLIAAALIAVRRFDERTRVALVRIAGAAWTGLTVLLTTQALRAQPLLAPDALTLGLAAALVLGTAGAAVAVLATGRRTAPAAVHV